MALNATNFVVKGPIKSADMMQFVNLFTGVMTDQPITFRNAVTIGGNQGTNTAPLSLYGSAGQTSNLLNLYPSTSSANPTWGIAALGQHSWGAGSPVVLDTFMSRVATQNGHATDTAGLLISPYLEVAGNISATGYLFPNSATLTGPTANPLRLVVNQDLLVNRAVYLGGVQNALRPTTNNSNIMSLQADAGYLMLSGNSQIEISRNVWFDGNAWQIYSTGSASQILAIESDGVLHWHQAPAGGLAWNSAMTLDGNGYLNIGSALTINTFRGANQASVNYHCSTPGASGDVTTFAENGSFYMWLGGSGSVYIQNNTSTSTTWCTVSAGAYFANNHNVNTGLNGQLVGGYNNGGGLAIYNSSAVSELAMWVDAGDQMVLSMATNGLRCVNQANSVQVWHCTTGGFWVDAGGITAPSAQINGAMTVTGGMVVSGSITINGYNWPYYCGQARWYSDSNVNFYNVANSTGSHWFQYVNSSGWAPVAGGAYTNNSSLKDKAEVRPIENPLSLVLDDNLHGISYIDKPSGEHRVGFVADAWLPRVPEIVQFYPDGKEILGMNYDRVGAITFEALKQYVQRTDARIAELEARLAA